MMTTRLPMIFGKVSDPQAFVKLPQNLYETGRQCVATIQTGGARDLSSFYEMWEAIVATDAGQPYREFNYNNSSTIRNGIPSTIARKGKPPINIVKYPHDISCVYSELLDLAPELWSGKRSVYEPGSNSNKTLEIDLMIHIGMHPDEGDYFLEKRAWREKYEHSGDNGKYLNRDALKGQPEKLLVGFDVEDIAEKVRQSLPVS
ncbi:MAG: hypothetical protein Q9208_003533 [Pyrenodesmia sp. 3 TL-2023]